MICPLKSACFVQMTTIEILVGEILFLLFRRIPAARDTPQHRAAHVLLLRLAVHFRRFPHRSATPVHNVHHRHLRLTTLGNHGTTPSRPLPRPRPTTIIIIIIAVALVGAVVVTVDPTLRVLWGPLRIPPPRPIIDTVTIGIHRLLVVVLEPPRRPQHRQQHLQQTIRPPVDPLLRLKPTLDAAPVWIWQAIGVPKSPPPASLIMDIDQVSSGVHPC